MPPNSTQRSGIGFLRPDGIAASYGLLRTLCAAGKVGQVLHALHLMLKDLIAGETRGSPEIKAFAELVLLRLGRALQNSPVPGKKYGQSGQVHAASAWTVDVLQILEYDGFTKMLAHGPLLMLLFFLPAT